jgi:hypothetical protein
MLEKKQLKISEIAEEEKKLREFKAKPVSQT